MVAVRVKVSNVDWKSRQIVRFLVKMRPVMIIFVVTAGRLVAC